MCHTGTESSCKVLHLSCVQRRSDLVDLLVVETVIERLSRPDAVALFAQAGNEQVTESLAGAQALRRRLARVVDAAAAGEVSPAALAGSRPSWHRRSRRCHLSPGRRAGRSRCAQAVGGVLCQGPVVASLVGATINRSSVGTRPFDPADIDVTWRTPGY